MCDKIILDLVDHRDGAAAEPLAPTLSPAFACRSAISRKAMAF